MSLKYIIARIKDTPVLWQTSHPKHTNKTLLNRVWKQMAKDLRVDENYLRKRWKNLKDKYRKELKRVLTSNDPDVEKSKICWPYYKPMSFIKSEVIKRFNVENVQLPTASDSELEDTSETSPPSAKKRQYDNAVLKNRTSLYNFNIPDNAQWENDPDYMYLLSILPLMKSLTETQSLQFKAELNDWLLELHTRDRYASAVHEAADEGSKICV